MAFGGIYAEAETYDIALVRLASAMMDDEKYNLMLIETLRSSGSLDSAMLAECADDTD
jgi:hypothetical protein